MLGLLALFVIAIAPALLVDASMVMLVKTISSRKVCPDQYRCTSRRTVLAGARCAGPMCRRMRRLRDLKDILARIELHLLAGAAASRDAFAQAACAYICWDAFPTRATIPVDSPLPRHFSDSFRKPSSCTTIACRYRTIQCTRITISTWHSSSRCDSVHIRRAVSTLSRRTMQQRRRSGAMPQPCSDFRPDHNQKCIITMSFLRS
jgi:hypothetical protein